MKKRKNRGRSSSIRLAGRIVNLLRKLRFVKRPILGRIDCSTGKGCARSRAKIGRDPIYGDRCILIKVSDGGTHQKIWIYIDSSMCKNVAMLKIVIMLADAGIAISFDEALKKRRGKRGG